MTRLCMGLPRHQEPPRLPTWKQRRIQRWAREGRGLRHCSMNGCKFKNWVEKKHLLFLSLFPVWCQCWCLYLAKSGGIVWWLYSNSVWCFHDMFSWCFQGIFKCQVSRSALTTLAISYWCVWLLQQIYPGQIYPRIFTTTMWHLKHNCFTCRS